jgi:hypothetical protein
MGKKGTAREGTGDPGTGFSAWENFWEDSVKNNERKMREANKLFDENNSQKGEIKWDDANYMQRCMELDRGIPREHKGLMKCAGCGKIDSKDVLMRLECAQCLEIYKERKMKVVVDAFERKFYCSEKCYCQNWEQHKMRHGPSWSRATRDDGNVYRFEAVETCGALWDSVLLKRKYFHECEPNTTWKEEVVNKNKEGEDEEETDDDDVVEDEHSDKDN